jgi:NAD(P)-dependent dehydrogenase (short-subunit alcohol dehydrogenase family)
VTLLAGKVAVVTGAGNGVGRAEAIELAAQGAAVVVNDIGGTVRGQGSDPDVAQAVVDQIVAAGGAAVANGDDVCDWSGALRLVRQAIDTFGGLDIVVNNAGIMRGGDIVGYSEQDFDDMMRSHTKGTFAMLRHVGGYWLAEYQAGRPRRGSVINTTSRAGMPGGHPGLICYGAAKAAVASLTISGALEFETFGARVNAIAPYGFTRMAALSIGADTYEPRFTDGFDPDNPANNGPLVAWLASDDSSHVNGQVFRVAGGEIQHFEPWRGGAVATSETGWDVAAVADGINRAVFGSRVVRDARNKHLEKIVARL